MKFDLTLATVLVFLVPGALVLLLAPIDTATWLDELRRLTRTPTATEALGMLCIAFVVGVALDSLRIVSMQPVIRAIARLFDKEGLPKSYLSSITKDRLEVFEMLVERSYEYYRLNCNAALGLTILAIAHVLTLTFDWMFLSVVTGAFVWIAIAVRSKLDSDGAIRAFVQMAKGG